MTPATATRTAIGNPRFYSTVSPIGDYTAHYRTGRQTAKKITLTNLPAITEYARSVREDETPGEANRQLWQLYNDLKTEATDKITESFRSFPPATGDHDELRTAILADYSRAVIIAIGDDEKGGNE